MLWGFGTALVVGIAFSGLVSLPVSVSTRGQLEPALQVAVRSLQGGVVSEVLVKSGSHVLEGQVLARLDTLELAAAEYRASAQVRESRINRTRLLEAMPIEAKLETERVAQAEATVLKTTTALRLQLVLYDRGSNVDSIMASYRPGQHIEIDRAVADLRSAQAELSIAHSQHERARLRELEARESEFGIERLRHDSAIASQRRQRLTLSAPVSGIVVTEKTEQLIGRIVREGDEIFTVADTSRWRVALIVAERDVARVRVGDVVRVDVPALKRQGGEGRLRGAVAFIGAAATSGDAVGSAGVTGYSVVVSLATGDGEKEILREVRQGLSVFAKIETRRVRVWRLLWGMVKGEGGGA